MQFGATSGSASGKGDANGASSRTINTAFTWSHGFRRTFRDSWAMLLFLAMQLLNFGLFLAVLDVGPLRTWLPPSITMTSSSNVDPPSLQGLGSLMYHGMLATFTTLSHQPALLGHIAASFGGLLVGGYGLLLLLAAYPYASILTAFASIMVVAAGVTLRTLMAGQTGAALFGVASLLAEAGLFYAWRSRISTSALLLENAARVVRQYPTTVVLALVVQLLAVGYTLGWLFLAAAVLARFSVPDAHSWIALYFAFTLFWTLSSLWNVLHTTVAGLFGTLYFAGSRVPSRPVLGALRRSLSSSFGSVLLGSMLVALVQLLQLLAAPVARLDDPHQGRPSRSSSIRRSAASASPPPPPSLLRQLVRWLLAQVHQLLRYFNHYAFVHVAIYGQPYLDSARATFQLIQASGMDLLANHSILHYLFAGVTLLAGLLFAGYSYLLAVSLFPLSQGALTALVGVSFIIGTLVIALLLGILRSGTTAFFVCFAQDPQALRLSDPPAYARFMDILKHQPSKRSD